jgi:hypothetical protein
MLHRVRAERLEPTSFVLLLDVVRGLLASDCYMRLMQEWSMRQLM